MQELNITGILSASALVSPGSSPLSQGVNNTQMDSKFWNAKTRNGTGRNKGFLHYNLAVLSHLVALFLDLLVSAISQEDEYPEDVWLGTHAPQAAMEFLWHLCELEKVPCAKKDETVWKTPNPRFLNDAAEILRYIIHL